MRWDIEAWATERQADYIERVSTYELWLMVVSRRISKYTTTRLVLARIPRRWLYEFKSCSNPPTSFVKKNHALGYRGMGNRKASRLY